MDKTSLVKEDIELGKQLIASLEEAGIEIKAALWFYMPESELWRLVIATPMYNEKGPRASYKRIQQELDKYPEVREFIDLVDITVVGVNDQIVQTFSGVIKTKPGKLSDMRLKRNRFNNVYVEDALIYRMN